MTDNTNTPPVPPVNPPPGSTKPSDSAIPIPVNSAGISSKSDMAEIVSDRMDRFGDVLAAMSDQLARHTLFLAEMVDLSKTQIQMEIENQRLADLRAKDGNEARPVVLPNGNTVNPVAGGGQAEEKGLLATLLGGAGGFLATAVSAYALRMLGKAGLVAFFAPIIGRWVTEFVTTFAEETGFSKEFAKGLGDAMGDFSLGALVGSIFGKRMALIFGLANMGAGLADDILDALGLNKDQILLKLGEHEFSLGDITTGIFGAITGGLALYVTSGAFMTKIAGLFKTSDVVAGSPSKFGKFGKFMKGAGLAAVAMGVVSGLFMMFGDDVANWLTEDVGMPENWAKVTVKGVNYALQGMTLGAMFGPGGMLVGAIAGLAIVVGQALIDWLVEAKKESIKKLNENLDKEGTDGIAKAIETGDYSALTANTGFNPNDIQDILDRRIAADPEFIKKLDGIRESITGNQEVSAAAMEWLIEKAKDPALSQDHKDTILQYLKIIRDRRKEMLSRGSNFGEENADYFEAAKDKGTFNPYAGQFADAVADEENFQAVTSDETQQALDAAIESLKEAGAKDFKMDWRGWQKSKSPMIILSDPTMKEAELSYLQSKTALGQMAMYNQQVLNGGPTVNNYNDNRNTTIVGSGGHSPALDGPGYANPGGR